MNESEKNLRSMAEMRLRKVSINPCFTELYVFNLICGHENFNGLPGKYLPESPG